MCVCVWERENVCVCINICVCTLCDSVLEVHMFTLLTFEMIWPDHDVLSPLYSPPAVLTSPLLTWSYCLQPSISKGWGGGDGSHACTDSWWATKLLNKHYLKYLKIIDSCMFQRCEHAEGNKCSSILFFKVYWIFIVCFLMSFCTKKKVLYK